MASSPVEILGSKYPLCKELIDKYSKKWQLRTKNMMTIWPQGGTFDVALCEEMDTLIKNYKRKGSSRRRQKRDEKRAKEREVLNMFKKEGEDNLRNIKKARKMLKEADKETTAKEQMFNSPPPYLQAEGQFPMLKGLMEVSGELKMEGEMEMEEKQLGASIKSKRSANKQNKGAYAPLDCYKQAREALEQMNKQCEDKLDYREPKEQTKSYNKERGAWGGIKDIDVGSTIGETEKLLKDTYDKVKQKRRLLFSSDEEEDWEESILDTGNWERGNRLRPFKQCPILIKGAQAQYVPWPTLDLEGLIARLPNIHEGAAKWIRVFEEESVGKLISLGDIKSLLAKTVGGAKMDEILHASNLDRAVNSQQMDGTIFDAFRPAVWQALRAEYPLRLDPNMLRGDQLEETENPITYVQRHSRQWKHDTEIDPERDPIMATLFRQAIIDSMPSSVKSRLEDVVGLNSKSHKEFCDYVTHAVEQYRKNEQKLKKQESELQRKLAQLQLDELTKKNKKKIQALVETEEGEPLTMMAPVTAPAPAMQSASQAKHPTNTQMTPPIINIYTQQPAAATWRKRPREQRGNGKAYVTPTGMCWGCGLSGHTKKDCPTNPWEQFPRGGREVTWHQTYPNPNQGPVNPWRGPNKGY